MCSEVTDNRMYTIVLLVDACSIIRTILKSQQQHLVEGTVWIGQLHHLNSCTKLYFPIAAQNPFKFTQTYLG